MFFCLSGKKLKQIKKKFAEAFRLQSKEQDPFYGKVVVQKGQKNILSRIPLPIVNYGRNGCYL